MNLNNIYERLRTEIDKEKHLDETTRLLVKSILIQCFADEQKAEFDIFCKEQRDFNQKMDYAITNLTLINETTKTN